MRSQAFRVILLTLLTILTVGAAAQDADQEFYELRAYRVSQPFRPFTLEAGVHREAFQGMTAVVMDHINELLDPEYRYADEQTSDGVRGMNRFLSS